MTQPTHLKTGGLMCPMPTTAVSLISVTSHLMYVVRLLNSSRAVIPGLTGRETRSKWSGVSGDEALRNRYVYSLSI